MYIIADVEWVQNEQNKQSPTQLAAVRVDDEWNIIDDFTAIRSEVFVVNIKT